jgi:hypothetical protein
MSINTFIHCENKAAVIIKWLVDIKNDAYGTERHKWLLIRKNNKMPLCGRGYGFEYYYKLIHFS